MEPIPRFMLKMTATHAIRTGTDDSAEPTYGTPVALSRVRWERRKSAVPGSYGDRAQYDATLLYDCTNSLPAGRTFAELDLVTFEGKDYVVRAVDETRDPFSDELAFVEVRLAGS